MRIITQYQLQKNTTRNFWYLQKLGSGYPIYPKSIIKVYTQTHIILHRLVVCVEFQLQVEKNNSHLFKLRELYSNKVTISSTQLTARE
jgi:hypothetical protein